MDNFKSFSSDEDQLFFFFFKKHVSRVLIADSAIVTTRKGV